MKRRLPEHPKAGLLWKTLQKAKLAWLERVIPEDFFQECALFLLDWIPEAVDADLKSFFRAANHHFYRVAVNYGFRLPRGGGYYVRQAEQLEPFEDAEEDGYEKKVAIQNWRSQAPENFLEFQERMELCKKVLSGDGSGRTDWYGFQAYLSGCNLNEISFLTGWEVSQVKRHLAEIIRRIREAVDIDPNLPLPPMPKNGKVEFRQGWCVDAGNRPSSRKPRQMVADPRSSIKGDYGTLCGFQSHCSEASSPGLVLPRLS